MSHMRVKKLFIILLLITLVIIIFAKGFILKNEQNIESIQIYDRVAYVIIIINVLLIIGLIIRKFDILTIYFAIVIFYIASISVPVYSITRHIYNETESNSISITRQTDYIDIYGLKIYSDK